MVFSLDVCFGRVCFRREKVSGNVTLRQTFHHCIRLVGISCCHWQCFRKCPPSLFYTLPFPLFRLAFVYTIYVCLCTYMYKSFIMMNYSLFVYVHFCILFSFIGMSRLTFAQDAWKLENYITYNLTFEKIAAIFSRDKCFLVSSMWLL